jgi:hypothetical protein
MFPGNNQIGVTSSKVPVKVRVTDQGGMSQEFTTPFSFYPNRFRDVTLTVISDQYASESFLIPRKVRVGMFILDFLLTPFMAGLLVDFSSGKIYEHETKHFVIHTDELQLKKAEAVNKNLKQFKATVSLSLIGKDKSGKDSELKVHKELKFKKVV